jgi:membrane protease YdiL (CAAX protease family)
MTSSTTSAERWPTSNRALAGWLVLAALQVALAFAAGGGADSGSEPFYDWSLAVGSLILYTAGIAITFWLAAAYPNARQALGLVRFASRWIWIAAALVVASLVVAAILEPVLHAGEEQGLAPDEWRPDRVAPFVVNGIVVATLVPFAEELFFRGLGVAALAPFGAAVAIGGTAIVFALAHGIPEAIPALGFLAVGLAWVRWKSASLWPCVIVHAAYNGIGVAVAYASAVS